MMTGIQPLRKEMVTLSITYPPPPASAAAWSEEDEFEDEFEDALRLELIRAGVIDDT